MSNMTNLDIDTIIEKLKAADDMYFNSVGSEEMSDAEYDRLKKTAFSIDPSNSYFTRVGSDVRGGKIRLPYTMGSLDQIYENEYSNWASKYANGGAVIVSRKKDGISGMVEYRSGEFQIAYSRGNGVEGADISRHAKYVKTLPSSLSGEDYLVVRGEFIMKNSVFKSNWASKYANPRVTVAGSMNRSDSIVPILEDIDFIAYEIVASNNGHSRTKKEQLDHLTALGFQVVNHEEFNSEDLNDAVLTALLADSRANSDYELDGLVITVNEISTMESKRSSISLNPEHSCKFKVNSESDEVITNVTNVIWEISKNGLFKPRVEVIPVNLFGTMVTYASGHNAKNILDKGIGIGAKIKITKAGSVIPYITSVITPTNASYPDSEYPIKWSDSGVELVLQDIDSHPTVRLKQTLDFVETLNVDLLKESSLTRIFNAYNMYKMDFAQSILTLVDLMEPEWENVLGSNGKKIYASLHRRLQNMDMATFLGAVKYFGAGFGVRKAKSLLENITDYDQIWKLTTSDIEKFDGFGTMSEQIAKGLPETKKLLDSLIAINSVAFVKETKTDELKFLNVVMTGFRDPDLEATIEKRGGKNGSGVSKKTTHLLTYDTTSNSGKAKKARELGITIMTPDEFKDIYNL